MVKSLEGPIDVGATETGSIGRAKLLEQIRFAITLEYLPKTILFGTA